LLAVSSGRSTEYLWSDGQPLDRLVNLKSVTKSVVSILVGCLVEDRTIHSVDTRLIELLPRGLMGSLHPSVAPEITLRHVMSMTGGWDWLENGHFTTYWLASPDPAAFALHLPCCHPPGSRFKYSNFAAHIVSAILTNVAGDTADYADRRLFKPLGISNVRWERLRDGRADGASNLWLSPMDLIRLGQRLVAGGSGVLPYSFLNEATRALSSGGHPEGLPYGLMWWIVPSGPAAGYFASGYGGQRVQVLTRLKRVVVTISDPAVPRGSLPDIQALMSDVAGLLEVPDRAVSPS
jgi:CubicO group peptidase (beta-lactamase class C family)